MEVLKWIVPAITWAVPLITAAFVAWVGFLQWRRAKRKAVLELNVRRFKLYESVKTCVDQFRINTQRFGGELKNQFLEAEEEARFYFDDGLHDYLGTLRGNILTVRDIDKYVASLQRQNKRISPTELAKLGAKRNEAMTHIQKFREVGWSKFANSRPQSWFRKLVKFVRAIPFYVMR